MNLKTMYPGFYATMDSDYMITGKESAADYSFQGYYMSGKEILD